MKLLRTTSLLSLGLFSLTLAASLIGCTDPKPRELTGSGMDMFAPLTLRIHPLTRLLVIAPDDLPPVPTTNPASVSHTQPLAGLIPTSQTSTPTTNRLEPIEVYLEMKDQFGDVGKGVGVVHLAVVTPRLGLLGGDTLAEWTVDLQAPTTNSQYWDSITRTYVFRSRPTARNGKFSFKPGQDYVVKITMDFPNNTQLEDQLTVTAKIPQP